jgi:hypothetical protein
MAETVLLGNKDERLEIRITGVEKRAWVEAAAGKGLTLSEWLRGMANGYIGLVGIRAPLCQFCLKVGGGRPACRTCIDNWDLTIKDCDEGRKRF